MAAATTSLPGDARWQPQLGLPLHLDPGRGVHHGRAPGPRLPRRGACVPGLHRRPAGRGAAPGDVRHRRRAGAARIDPRPPRVATRAPDPCASATAPSTSGSTTCGAGWCISSSVTCAGRDAPVDDRTWAIVQRMAAEATATGDRRTRASGRSVARPGTSVRRSSWHGWRWTGPRGSRSDEATRRPPARWRAEAAAIRDDLLRQRGRRPGCLHPDLRGTGAGRLDAAGARSWASCPGPTRACGPPSWPSPTS